MADPVLIRIPKESVSDEDVLLARWLIPDRARVARGTVIAVIETSKNAVDIESPADGYLSQLEREGARVAVGAPFAAIADSADARAVKQKVPQPAPDRFDSAAEARFSKRARQLIEANKIDPQTFAHLPLVRGEDVESFLRGARKGERELPLNLPVPRPTDVLLWGGGGHAKVCIEIIRAAGTHTIYGIVDRGLAVGTSILGVPVLASDDALEKIRIYGVEAAVLGIGAVQSHRTRWDMLRRLQTAGYRLPNLVHPAAAIASDVKMGAANVIFPHATVSADVVIGDGCILNSGSVISHDCRLGNNVHLAPGALLAGGVEIGDNTLIGMASAVFLYKKIGRDVRINNGVIVDSDVPDGAILRR